MKRTQKIAVIALFAVIALTIAYFTLNYTKEGNAIIATSFVKNEATYKFDGISETFKLTGTVALDCPYCWEFQFEYRSRNSGYGDRTGAGVYTVLTNHTARITMEKGRIRMAVLDDKWDMMARKMSPQQPGMPAQQQKPYEERDDEPRR